MFTNSFMQDIEVNIYTFQQELVMIKESLKEQKEMIFNLQNYMQNMKLKFEHLEENVLIKASSSFYHQQQARIPI